MTKLWSLWLSNIFLVTLILANVHSDDVIEDRKVHIVYMGSLPKGQYALSSQHFSLLQEVVETSFIRQSLVRSYSRSFNAFAANITETERQKLDSIEGVVSIFPSKILKTQTTRSWDFMGFSKNVHRNPIIESDVIVGVIDTGIWPEIESFSDEGFGPTPKKWKGTCQGGKNFTCNNKIIGARYYNVVLGDDDARDRIGHGSHTASTAAGNYVENASFYGVGQGTARGGVPSSRIAAYKVCDRTGCRETDVLAAFDDAIADGVDIITISLGRDNPSDLFDDALAIGAFHAMDHGILTVNSAGNHGTSRGKVTSVAPWLLSVAASSTDRRIIGRVDLGNKTTLVSNVVNSFEPIGSNAPLIYGKDVTSQCDEYSAQICSDGCLDSKLVNGKIVVCDDTNGINEAHRTEALGSIIPSRLSSDVSFCVPMPGSFLSPPDMDLVKSYINSTKLAYANISKSEAIRDLTAPVIASFSSKGPNSIIPNLLKPDISAPGVDILAAFSPAGSITDDPLDKRSVKYSLLSGTSMSCPHVAGAAAYVKTFHPDWSPSAIKSALMTTAWPMNSTINPDREFAYGAGHLDPVKAVNPGLVYETFKDDYVNMLCNMGYDPTKLKKIVGDNSTCVTKTKKKPHELNYPSMAGVPERVGSFTVTFTRTVTNVGLANSTYQAKITPGSHIDVKVEPSTLSFKSLNEKKSFVVTATGTVYRGGIERGIVSASLVWFDGTHSVRSPIVVYLP